MLAARAYFSLIFCNIYYWFKWSGPAQDWHNAHNRRKMNFMIRLYKSSIFRLEVFYFSRFTLPNHLLPSATRAQTWFNWSLFLLWSNATKPRINFILPNHQLPRYGFGLQLAVLAWTFRHRPQNTGEIWKRNNHCSFWICAIEGNLEREITADF